MNLITITLLAALLVTSSVSAGLPAQDDIFAIGSFTPSKTDYFSADYLFSAPPFYEKVGPSERIHDYPSHKKAELQQGAIVLRDKTVLFFDTRSSKYLSVVDPSGHATFYRLPKPPAIRRRCPAPPPDLNALPFPKPGDVFCVAMFPWNKGRHFTPLSLVEALPRFRPLSEKDIPDQATRVYTGTGYGAFPKQWVEAQHENAEPLNGVLVLNNRAVLTWITWTSHAIAFANYHSGTYFVIGQ